MIRFDEWYDCPNLSEADIFNIKNLPLHTEININNNGDLGPFKVIVKDIGTFFNLDTIVNNHYQKIKIDSEQFTNGISLKNTYVRDYNPNLSGSTLSFSDKGENPKHKQGIKKFTMSSVPPQVLAEIGAAMTEGAVKYGFFNFRHVKISASTYYDANMRHMFAWWEGQDNDPDSGINHVTKAIASLILLRDSMMTGMIDDDRPPRANIGWEQNINQMSEKIREKYSKTES